MTDRSGELGDLLADIVFWGERVSQHLADSREDDFLQNALLCDAICWCISCVGEAAGKIRQGWPDFSFQNPDLELAQSYAMRNRIVHGYFGVDARVVWNVATISLPRLAEAARKRINENRRS